MTKGFLKSSKRKQNFVTKRSPRNESIYKAYKFPFESLKIYYTGRLESYQNNINKSWDVIKEIIGRAKSTKGNFS